MCNLSKFLIKLHEFCFVINVLSLKQVNISDILNQVSEYNIS